MQKELLTNEQLRLAVEKKWIDDTAKKGLPAAAFIADIKATSAKYAAMSPNDVMLAAINNPQQGMYDMKK